MWRIGYEELLILQRSAEDVEKRHGTGKRYDDGHAV
jgi:hypothetical protein